MSLFFEMLFAVLPYIGMFLIGWFGADRLDTYSHRLDVLTKHINAQDKKIASLTKQHTTKKK